MKKKIQRPEKISLLRKYFYPILMLLSLVLFIVVLPLVNDAGLSQNLPRTAQVVTWPIVEVYNYGDSGICPLQYCSTAEIITVLTRTFYPIVGLCLYLMLIYAGYNKLTAAADIEKAKKAMQTMKYAIVGTVLVVLARVITQVIASFFGAPVP